jgi:UDP-N-acetylmuramoyl-L-alanyl-D-glutamate--2,6-diaminopimelate ligase
MRLGELLKEAVPDGGLPDIDILGLAADSRRVQDGFLFVATRGGTFDGHDFLRAAVERGAVFLVGENPDPSLDVPYRQVADSRRFLAEAAAAWHAFPGRRMRMIGVTGTDGKTTTAWMLHGILEAAGQACGVVTSVGAQIGSEEIDTGFHVTTPDPLDLQALLERTADAGAAYAIVETTSHGLAQQRVAACDFDVGILTNVTHEHLDFHGSFQAYLEAKGSLFAGLSQSAAKPFPVDRAAVLNRDDESFSALRERASVRVVTYGAQGAGDVRAEKVLVDRSGVGFLLKGERYRLPVRLPVLGAYNVSNALAAAAAGIEVLGVAPEAAVGALEGFAGVPGRMERIEMGQPFLAIVDFAHTPNALLRALQTARNLTDGRVITVFGAAGLRDREKRHMMAAVAARNADLSIFTAEDPRTESLAAILEAMAAGARDAGGIEERSFWRVPDRREALRKAVGLADANDVVLACGKGHEQSMAFGETEYAWDDRIGMRAALAERMGLPGPEMPALPSAG